MLGLFIQEYQRFQITFRTVNDANELISAIRDVCPCKPNNSSVLREPIRAIPTNSSFSQGTHQLTTPSAMEVDMTPGSSLPFFSSRLLNSSQRFQTPAGSQHPIIPETPRRSDYDQQAMPLFYDTPCKNPTELPNSSQTAYAPFTGPELGSQRLEQHTRMEITTASMPNSAAHGSTSHHLQTSSTISQSHDTRSSDMILPQPSGVAPLHLSGMDTKLHDQITIPPVSRNMLENVSSQKSTLSNVLNSVSSLLPALADEQLEEFIANIVHDDAFIKTVSIFHSLS